jgi:hypothetical protein
MNWLDQLYQGLTPNAAGDVNKAIAASPLAAERGPSGSFDTSRLGDMLGADAKPDLDYLAAIQNMQRDAIGAATKKPELSGMQWLGNALSAASVPVAYAQGNDSYGRAMTGRTGADIHNGRVRDYEDQARKAQMDLAGTQAQQYGDFGLGVLKDKREKKREIRIKVADIIRSGQSRPDAIKAAADWAEAQGDSELASQLRGGVAPGNAPASPVGSPAPAGVAPAPAGPAATPAPPVASGPASAPAPGGVLGGVSGMAGNLPSAANDPAQAQAAELRRQAAMETSLGNPERAKILEEEAKALLMPGEKYREQFAKDRATSEAEMASKQVQAVKSQEQIDQFLSNIEDTLKVPGISRYIGPLEGGMVGKYFTDTLNDYVPGNKANPAHRDIIESAQNNIVNVLQRLTRIPGIGAQSDAELRQLISSIGEITSSRNAEEAMVKVNNMKERIRVILSGFGGEVPEISSVRQPDRASGTASAAAIRPPPSVTPEAAAAVKQRIASAPPEERAAMIAEAKRRGIPLDDQPEPVVDRRRGASYIKPPGGY